MSVRFYHCLGFALALLVAGLTGLHAQEATKGPPTPIIFSVPRSDTVSSNLNQIGTKSSPLTDLESGLKKPFEIFDTGRSAVQGPASTGLPYTPSTPTLNNKKLKDILDKRAEDSYLLAEDGDSALSKDDLSKSGDDPFDSTGKRPKTSLDHYYDRIDRLRDGATNQTSRSLDLFGDKSDSDEKEDSKSRKSGGLFDKELSAQARELNPKSNNVSGGNRLSSEKLKSRSFGDIFELGPVESGQATARTKETRLDEFKRLINGPGYGTRNEFNVAPPPSYGSAYQPPKPIVAAPSPIISGGPQTAGGYAKPLGFSGAVGGPVGVPEYAASSPSLTPTPPVQQPATKPPVLKFEIPRRQF